MRAGPMRHRLTLQREVETRVRGGGADSDWQDLGKVWAEITLPTGRLAPVAEGIETLVTAEIRIRPRSDAVAGCRLVETVRGVSTTYLIEAALLDNANSMLRLLCSNVINP